MEEAGQLVTGREALLAAADTVAEDDPERAARARAVLGLMPKTAPAFGYWVVSHLAVRMAADPTVARADAQALARVAEPAGVADVLAYARSAADVAAGLGGADTGERERARLAWLDRCAAVPLEPPDFGLGGDSNLELAVLVAVVRRLDEQVREGALAPLDADPVDRLTVVDAVLEAPSDDGRSSLREQVRSARLAAWSTRPGARRAELMEAVLDKVSEPVTPGEDERAAVEPLRWLLEQARDGLAVDRRRRPERPVLRALAASTGWPTSRLRAPRRSAGARAQALLELALVLRLLRRKDARTLVASPLGTHAVNHPAVLWQRVVRSLVACTGPLFSPVLEADLLLFLRDPRPQLADHMTARAELLRETDWAGVTVPGSDPGRLASTYQRWVEPLAAGLGLFAVDRQAAIMLPPEAERTALAALRGYATGPRHTAPLA